MYWLFLMCRIIAKAISYSNHLGDINYRCGDNYMIANGIKFIVLGIFMGGEMNLGIKKPAQWPVLGKLRHYQLCADQKTLPITRT